MNFKMYCAKFYRYVIAFKSSGTANFYIHHLELLQKYVPDDENFIPDNDFLFDLIYKFKSQNLSNNTINKRILCLRTVYSYNGIDIPKVPRLKEVKKSFDYLTYIEVKHLLDYIDDSSLSLQSKLILRLFLDTGVRLSEMLSIKVENVNLSQNCILLNDTKTKVERYVFFTDETKFKYLSIYLKDKFGMYLFDLSSSGVESLFERVKKRLCLPKFSPHMMRHTYATILVNHNTNLEFIRNTLGHSSLEVTKKYLHYSQENLYNCYKENFNYE